MDSLNAIVQGAVAFDSPNDSPQAKKDQQYRLYPNLQAAKRGVEVAITVPNSAGLKAGKLPCILRIAKSVCFQN